ncbi:MAG TPA: hypothetical protein VFE47_12090 [Tepidisphaeraceae bacterium]|nr:hypothetical protein [Tepidisphaeraceae bacterium]
MPRKTRSIVLTLIGSLVVAIISGGCAKSPETKLLKARLDDRTIQFLAAPDRVEVFRITTEITVGKQKSLPKVPVAKPLDTALAGRLSQIILNDKSYEWNTVKQCIINPGVGYRFWRGKESITVLVCFQCNEIGILPDITESQKMKILECDPARGALLELTKQALPDDQHIRELTVNSRARQWQNPPPLCQPTLALWPS